MAKTRTSPSESIGKKYGRLTVASLGKSAGKTTVIAKCECGSDYEGELSWLRSGNTKSCGCLPREIPNHLDHGEARRVDGKRVFTKEYRAWASIRNRTMNPNDKKWHRYGGRGIKLCEKWQSYSAFLADVGRAPSPRHSIDRFPDNDGNYEPGNVRWATQQEQGRNTSTNQMLTIKGVTKCMKDWAEETTVKYGTIQFRVAHGWDHERAVFQTKRTRRTREEMKSK